MKLYVLNGPNLNMLGFREPELYGTTTYAQLVEMIEAHCAEMGIEVVCLQSNYEGQLVEWIQQAYFEGADGIVINPGAYTHTSIALLDAVKSVNLPTVEIHISKLDVREPFRQVSYLRVACINTIIGRGIQGYLEAVDELVKWIGENSTCK